MQGKPFAVAAGVMPAFGAGDRLALTLAIQRICRRARDEGKTVVREATLRKMERQVRQLRKELGVSRVRG